MCRIAYIPRPGLVEEQDLIDLFGHLEKGMGGDGNGLTLSWGEDELETVKGLDVEVEELARMAALASGPALFHTRRATTGAVCDALCQPFMVDEVAVAHNGVWRDWDDVALQLILQGRMDGESPINDSFTAAVLASKFGRYTLETINHGVFVVMSAKGAWLHLRGGSFEFCPDLGIYASEFPKDWPSTKAIRSNSIADLSADGPDFECGGWRIYTAIPRGHWDPEERRWVSAEESAEEEIEVLPFVQTRYLAGSRLAPLPAEEREIVEEMTDEELAEEIALAEKELAADEELAAEIAWLQSMGGDPIWSHGVRVA